MTIWYEPELDDLQIVGDQLLVYLRSDDETAQVSILISDIEKKLSARIEKLPIQEHHEEERQEENGEEVLNPTT